MRREPGTIPPARSSDTREGPTANHVVAGGESGNVFYGNPGHLADDRWEPERSSADPSGGGIRGRDEDVPERAAAHDLRVDGGGQESVRAVH